MINKDAYAKAGVDIDAANDSKRQMAEILDTNDKKVLNKVGAFATLFDGAFPDYKHPVLVFKTEEPGTKQKLAFENGRPDSIGRDLIAHLANDIAVMGAAPLSVQDCIVCGKLEKDVVLKLVSSLAEACRENGCTLTGGETSEQPGVVDAGTYILTASIVGVVEKTNIIDGSAISDGDAVLALASSGVHTNGFSLIRKIMRDSPEIIKEQIEGKTFMENILTPHRSYYNPLKDLFAGKQISGLAHITGGGITENLDRILPDSLDAEIELDKIKILPIFKTLKKFGNLDDADMLRTFNMGVGLTAVVKPGFVSEAVSYFKKFNIDAYQIGTIIKGGKKVNLKGALDWNA